MTRKTRPTAYSLAEKHSWLDNRNIHVCHTKTRHKRHCNVCRQEDCRNEENYKETLKQEGVCDKTKRAKRPAMDVSLSLVLSNSSKLQFFVRHVKHVSHSLVCNLAFNNIKPLVQRGIFTARLLPALVGQRHGVTERRVGKSHG